MEHKENMKLFTLAMPTIGYFTVKKKFNAFILHKKRVLYYTLGNAAHHIND